MAASSVNTLEAGRMAAGMKERHRLCPRQLTLETLQWARKKKKAISSFLFLNFFCIMSGDIFVHDQCLAFAKAANEGFFDFLVVSFADVTGPCSWKSERLMVWPAPCQVDKVVMLFLMACRRGEIPVGRDCARMIARLVWVSRREMTCEWTSFPSKEKRQLGVVHTGVGKEKLEHVLSEEQCALVLVRDEKQEKLTLFFWAPGRSSIKQQMLFSHSKSLLMSRLDA